MNSGSESKLRPAPAGESTPVSSKKLGKPVKTIMRLTDRHFSIDQICAKTGEDKQFVEDVVRMYLTHPGVSVQGILDRIEIKGK